MKNELLINKKDNKLVLLLFWKQQHLWFHFQLLYFEDLLLYFYIFYAVTQIRWNILMITAFGCLTCSTRSVYKKSLWADLMQDIEIDKWILLLPLSYFDQQEDKGIISDRSLHLCPPENKFCVTLNTVLIYFGEPVDVKAIWLAARPIKVCLHSRSIFPPSHSQSTSIQSKELFFGSSEIKGDSSNRNFCNKLHCVYGGLFSLEKKFTCERAEQIYNLMTPVFQSELQDTGKREINVKTVTVSDCNSCSSWSSQSAQSSVWPNKPRLLDEFRREGCHKIWGVPAKNTNWMGRRINTDLVSIPIYKLLHQTPPRTKKLIKQKQARSFCTHVLLSGV